jgi:hypothetical protein
MSKIFEIFEKLQNDKRISNIMPFTIYEEI